MAKPTVTQIADAMFAMIADAAGKKKYKAGDLQKAMREVFGDQNVDRDDVKLAIRDLIESGRCIYTYYGGSYIEIPRPEGG